MNKEQAELLELLAVELANTVDRLKQAVSRLTNTLTGKSGK